jgi:hypothetical protein
MSLNDGSVSLIHVQVLRKFPEGEYRLAAWVILKRFKPPHSPSRSLSLSTTNNTFDRPDLTFASLPRTSRPHVSLCFATSSSFELVDADFAHRRRPDRPEGTSGGSGCLFPQSSTTSSPAPFRPRGRLQGVGDCHCASLIASKHPLDLLYNLPCAFSSPARNQPARRRDHRP